MKRKFRTMVMAVLFITAPLFSLGQLPPHPNGGNAPDSGNGPVGGGAAIGGGLSIMIAMGAAYGLHRYYQMKVIDTRTE
jgi:hypothetical protein